MSANAPVDLAAVTAAAGEMAKTWAKPDWYQTFRAKWLSGASHVFVFHGNVQDYVLPATPMADYLSMVLGSALPYQAYYSLHQGITFPDDRRHAAFEKIT